MAFQDVIDTTLPDTMLLQKLEGMPGALFGAVGGALDSYVASREISFLGAYARAYGDQQRRQRHKYSDDDDGFAERHGG